MYGKPGVRGTGGKLNFGSAGILVTAETRPGRNEVKIPQDTGARVNSLYKEFGSVLFPKEVL